MDENYVAGITCPNDWPTEDDEDSRKTEVGAKCQIGFASADKLGGAEQEPSERC